MHRPQDTYGAIARIGKVDLSVRVHRGPRRTGQFRAGCRTTVSGVANGTGAGDDGDAPIRRYLVDPFAASADVPIGVGFRKKGVARAIHGDAARTPASGERQVVNDAVWSDSVRAVIAIGNEQIARFV